MSSKRQQRIFATAFLALCLFLSLWAFVLEPSHLSIAKTTIALPHWQNEHNGLKVAILADLHVGAPHQGVAKLQQTVARTNAEAPDLIVLLGDYVIHGVVGGTFVEPEVIAAVLKDFQAPLGVVAVLGNHDWWYDGERVRKALQSVHIRVLENEVMRVEHRRQTFWIIGLADLWTRDPDIKGSLEKISDQQPIVLLTHSPDIFPEIPSRISLTLAGHTHGGQVNLPIVGRPVVPSRFGQRYAYGHMIEEGRHLFVSSGIGTSILPVRFRVPPEVVILTITAHR